MRTRAALLLCLALVLPAAARAQALGSITVTESSNVDAGGKNDAVINILECAGTATDSLSLAWVLNATPATDSSLNVWASTDSACPPSATAAAKLESGILISKTTGGPYQVVAGVLKKSPLNITCPTGTTITLYLCVTEKPAASSTETSRASGNIVIDGTRPSPPAGVSTTPGDGALNVSWNSTSTGTATATSFTATANPVDATGRTGCNSGGSPGSCTVTGGGSCRIGGLTNLACYLVSVVGYSDARNPSDESGRVLGIPLPVDSFWDHYTKDGGLEQGGCGGPAGALALVALLPLGWRLRRRRP